MALWLAKAETMTAPSGAAGPEGVAVLALVTFATAAGGRRVTGSAAAQATATATPEYGPQSSSDQASIEAAADGGAYQAAQGHSAAHGVLAVVGPAGPGLATAAPEEGAALVHLMGPNLGSAVVASTGLGHAVILRNRVKMSLGNWNNPCPPPTSGLAAE